MQPPHTTVPPRKADDPSCPTLASFVPLPAGPGQHDHAPPQYSQLAAQLRHQIEFYFSDSNLSRDEFLRSLLQSRDHPGAVPVATIASFPRVREIYAKATAEKMDQEGAGGGGRGGGSVLTSAATAKAAAGPADPCFVGWSLRGSHLVEVSDDGHWIRPCRGNGVGVSSRSHRHPSPNDDLDRRDYSDHSPLILASSASSAVTAKGTIPTTTSSSSTTTATPSASPTSFDSTELSVLQSRDRTLVVWIPNHHHNNQNDVALAHMDASDVRKAFATFAGVQPVQVQLVEDGAAGRSWHILFATEEDAQVGLEASRTRHFEGTPLQATLLRTALATAATTAPPSTGEQSHPIPATVSTRSNDVSVPVAQAECEDQDHPPTIAGHNASQHPPEHHLYPIPMVPLVGTYPPMPMSPPPYGYAPLPTATYGFHPQQGYVVGVQPVYHTSPSYVWATYPSPAMASPIPEPHPPHFAPGPVYYSNWDGTAGAVVVEGVDGGFPESGLAHSVYAMPPPQQHHPHYHHPPFPTESVAFDKSAAAYMMQYAQAPASSSSPPRQRGQKKKNRYRHRHCDDVSSSHASNNSTTDDDDDSNRGRHRSGGNDGDHNHGRGGNYSMHPPRPQQQQRYHAVRDLPNKSIGGADGRPPTGAGVNVTGKHSTTKNAASGERRGPTRFASPANRAPPSVEADPVRAAPAAASDTGDSGKGGSYPKKQWPNKKCRSRNPPKDAADNPVPPMEREGWSSTDEDFPALSPGSLGGGRAMAGKADTDLQTAKTAPPLPYAAAVRNPRHLTPTKGAASTNEAIHDAETDGAGSGQGGPLVHDFQGLAVSD